VGGSVNNGLRFARSAQDDAGGVDVQHAVDRVRARRQEHGAAEAVDVQRKRGNRVDGALDVGGVVAGDGADVGHNREVGDGNGPAAVADGGVVLDVVPQRQRLVEHVPVGAGESVDAVGEQLALLEGFDGGANDAGVVSKHVGSSRRKRRPLNADVEIDD